MRLEGLILPEKTSVFTLVGIFIIALVLNILYPAMSDDYSFRYVWHGEYGSFFKMVDGYPLERIEGVGDVLASLKSLYFTWGGRMIIWSLAYLFAALPDIVFDLANSLVFVVLIIMLTMLGTLSFSLRELQARWLALAFVFLWGTSMMFASTYLWMAGSVGYLWVLIPQLGFLYFYIRFFVRGEEPRFFSPLMFIIGIFAGQSNENSGGAVILLAMGLTFIAWRSGKRLSWQIWGLAGALLGFLVLITAPGNFARVAETMAPLSVMDLPRQQARLIIGIICCVPTLISFLWLYRIKGSVRREKARVLSKAFFLAGLLSLLVVVPLPNVPIRVLTGSAVFWLIGALLFISHDESALNEKPVKLLGGAYVVLTVLSLVLYIYAMGAYFARQDWERDALAAQSAGQDLYLPPYHAPDFLGNIVALKGYRADCGTLSPSPERWENQVYADIWNLKSVVRKEFFVPD